MDDTVLSTVTASTGGVLKTMVFEGTDHSGNVILGRALQAGHQVDVHGQVPETSGPPVTAASTTGLAAIAVNEETLEEIQAIHKACVKFIDRR